MKVISFDCPEVSSLSGYTFTGFPNPMNESTKLLKFIAGNPGCTRDALYDHFSSIEALMWFRNNDLVKYDRYNNGGYELTAGGKGVIKFIEWIEPVYDLLKIFKETNPQNFDEFDVTATIAGRHDLLEEDIMTKVEIIRQYCNNCSHDGWPRLQGVQDWMSEVFNAIIYELIGLYGDQPVGLISIMEMFKEKYNLDFS